MKYEISHLTTYDYGQPVAISHHVLHLIPRPCGYQERIKLALDVSPQPTLRGSGADYFGNPVTYLTLQTQHTQLKLHAESTIIVSVPPAPDPDSTHHGKPFSTIFAMTTQKRLWKQSVRIRLAVHGGKGGRRRLCARILYAGPTNPFSSAELTSRIYRDFAYDDEATTVSTPVDEVFSARRGVCQDFAHLQIACLRALSVPVRYVSGYLLTHPPEGQERLEGADASHAWLSIWCPGHGWVDLDPTNDMVPSGEHITLAWGRDYADVSPVNGRFLAAGSIRSVSR